LGFYCYCYSQTMNASVDDDVLQDFETYFDYFNFQLLMLTDCTCQC
jgi:hypothetical protein